MPRTRPAYLALLDVSRELGCSANALREWAKRADLDASVRSDGPTADERDELAKQRRRS